MKLKIRKVSLDGGPNELIRRIRAAQAVHSEARAASSRLAKLLWVLRKEGVKPSPASKLVADYSAARSRLMLTAHLLMRLQTQYKKRYGKPYTWKRRHIHEEAASGS